MTYVEALRVRFAGFLTGWIWANTALLAIVVLSRETANAVGTIAAGAGLAAVATLSWWLTGADWRNRQISSIAALGQVMLLVSILAGHPYQVEMHLYFLAVLASCRAGWTGASSSPARSPSRSTTPA